MVAKEQKQNDIDLDELELKMAQAGAEIIKLAHQKGVEDGKKELQPRLEKLEKELAESKDKLVQAKRILEAM